LFGDADPRLMNNVQSAQLQKATMRPTGKVIVTCAVTGSAHTPTMNNDIPMTIDEHVEQSVAAAAAGAAVIHLHARNPQDGRPVSDVGIFRDYCRGIKDRCDAVISITTGGALAEQVVAAAPLAVAAVLEIVEKSAGMTVRDGYALLRSGAIRNYEDALVSDDAREGPTAFVEKRLPRWQGR